MNYSNKFMKKKCLLLVLLLTPSIALAFGGKPQATVFNPLTGERKAVEINKNSFNGGYVLETKTENLITYWQKKIDSGYKDLYKIPDKFWNEINPQIITFIPKYGQLGNADLKSTICRGKECDKYKKAEAKELGFSVASSYRTTLSGSMTSTQTTINVSSITAKDGTTLTMGLLGTKVYLTIEPGGSKEEIVMCTGISGVSWAGCTRGLSFTGTSTAAVTANQKTHSAGQTIMMSNVHYVYDELVDKDTADTINGVKTYSQFPISPSSAPTTDYQFANKKYVDDTAIAGGAIGTESTAGIWKGATQTQMASSTPNDGTYGYILQSKYATSSPYTSGLYIPITQNDGKLSPNFIGGNNAYSFTATTTQEGANITNLNATGSNYLASTTFTNIPKINGTPTDPNDAINKNYADNTSKSYIELYSHEVISNTTGSEKNLFSKCSVSGLGLNDSLHLEFITSDSGTSVSGNNTTTLYFGNGTATTTLVTRTVNYGDDPIYISANIWNIGATNSNNYTGFSMQNGGAAVNPVLLSTGSVQNIDTSSKYCINITANFTNGTAYLFGTDVIRSKP